MSGIPIYCTKHGSPIVQIKAMPIKPSLFDIDDEIPEELIKVRGRCLSCMQEEHIEFLMKTQYIEKITYHPDFGIDPESFYKTDCGFYINLSEKDKFKFCPNCGRLLEWGK